MNFKVVKAKKGKLENSESNKLFRKRQMIQILAKMCNISLQGWKWSAIYEF